LTARDFCRLAVTLLIGGVGGWCLNLLNVPLAWMLGAMIVTAILSAAGAPLKASKFIRALMLAVLGVAIGSTFSPDLLQSAGAWVVSLCVLALYAVTTSLGGAHLLSYVSSWSPATRFFSAVPGGLTDMILAGGERGGDEPTMALIHTIRIMVTVLVIPLAFSLSGHPPDRLAPGVVPSWEALTGDGAFWLFGAGIIGMLSGKFVRLPAYVFTGPMIASVAVHLAGLSAAKPPADIVNVAQVAIGVSIGCRFVGVNVRMVAQQITVGIGYGLTLVTVGALFAVVTEQITGLSFWSLWLAFAPGGLAEMVLMGLAVGIDPAFVSTHHLFRFLLVLLIARGLFVLYRRISGDPPPPLG